MTDLEHINDLLTSHHPCIAVATFEEDYVLGLLRQAAVDRGWDLWLWSITRGVCDGLLADSPPVLNTEHPAAALYHFARQQPHKQAMYVMLDVADHLKDGRTLRLLREAVERAERIGGTLALVDHLDELPPVVEAMATRFEI